MKPLGNAEISHRRPAAVDRFWFGAPYYPEHWDAAVRDEDVTRMAAAGFNMVRMAEFAWDRIEPAEGEYHFELFDRVIASLGEQGIMTMLCTPTATPPRWLTLEHPEILRVDADGHPLRHGSRQHCCHASPVFREYSRRITRVMAEHYQDNPHVVAWQTDNEINCHFAECHCESCQTAFRVFLRRKFGGDIEELNAAWGTAFWSQTYDRFSDVITPIPGRPTYLNPAHQLDYYRFIYETVAEFQHDQIEILRLVQPAWFVTHNGTMQHVDYRGAFGRDLDVLGYDLYPCFVTDPQIRWHSQCFKLDRTRALTGNFIIPEHQSGPGGQGSYFHDHPEPGELRAMSHSSVARGADSLMYFRWRTCRFGAEEYWCGILDHDNVPRRRYDEVARFGAEMQRVGPAILGTHVHIDCAVAAGDVAVNDAHGTYSLGLPKPDSMAELVHKQLLLGRYAVGAVHPSDDLTGLKLYVVPHWSLFNRRWVANLTQFVESGGVLVIGARTATRNMNNNVVAGTPPGCLRSLAGVSVQEYGRKNSRAVRPVYLDMQPEAVQAEHWYEVLDPEEGTDVLVRWSGRHLTGQPAVTCRKQGKGSVVYVGTYLVEPMFEALLPMLAERADLEPLWSGAPRGIEIVRRQSENKRVWFFINHLDGKAETASSPAGRNLLTGEPATGGPMTLDPHGVAVIEE